MDPDISPMWDLVHKIGAWVIYLGLAVIGFFARKILGEQAEMKKNVEQNRIDISVLQSQMTDNKDDIKDIKSSIDNLAKSIKDDWNILSNDIKEIIRRGQQ